LKAVAHGLAITRLALYERPYVAPPARPEPSVDHAAKLAELIVADPRGDAVEYFQTDIVGIPA
jgi:hypothetical protein